MADAEPIDAGYGIPAAPIVRIAPVVHTIPHAPVVHHAIPHAPVVHAIPQHHHIGHTIAAPATPFHAAPFVNHAPLVHSVPAPIAPARFTVPAPAAPAPFSIPAPVAAPVPIFSSPIAHAALPAPLVAPSSQFHAQDEFGQFSFGHESINQARTESRDAFGVTRGSYQYVDANGLLQTVHYVADPINGFRVAATNLPVAGNAAPLVAPVHVTEPLVAPVHETEPLIAPLPVEETPEVAAARAEHLALVAEATAAAAAAPEERKKRETEAGYGRKKRDADAEPIDAGYGIPAAPIVRIAPVVHVPAPVLPAPAPLVHTIPHAPIVHTIPHAPAVHHAIPHAPVVLAIPQHHHMGHTIAAPATPM